MSGAGFNGIEALRSRVLMDVKIPRPKISKGCSLIVSYTLVLERKAYNNHDITIFSVY